MYKVEKIKEILFRYDAGPLLVTDVGAKEFIGCAPGLEAVSAIHAFEPNLEKFNTLKNIYNIHSFHDLFLNQTGLSEKSITASFLYKPCVDE